jgi:hypothetical protein
MLVFPFYCFPCFCISSFTVFPFVVFPFSMCLYLSDWLWWRFLRTTRVYACVHTCHYCSVTLCICLHVSCMLDVCRCVSPFILLCSFTCSLWRSFHCSALAGKTGYIFAFWLISEINLEKVSLLCLCYSLVNVDGWIIFWSGLFFSYVLCCLDMLLSVCFAC